MDGDTVTVGLRDGLADGPYVVAWNVVSADSHPVNGAFTFVVGAGADASREQVASLLAVPSDTAWRIAAGVGRFASYAGILLAAGAVVFLTVVDRRRPSKRIVQLVTGAAAIGVVGLLVQIPLQAAIATETGWRALRSPSRWIDVLSNSGLRWATLLGVVGAAIVVVAVHALASEHEQGWAPWAGLVGAAVAFVSFSLTGHTRVTTPGWLVIPADAVHVAAAGMWFGGLVLLVVAWTARRRDGDAVAAAGLVDRFSQMAIVTVVAVAVSGVILGWKEVGSLSALTSTRYGWTLVAKLCVVAFVGGLAAYNHWRLVPDIRRTGKRVVSATGAATSTEASVGGPGAAKTTRSALAWRRLETTVRSEIVGLVVVLAITSALVAITPAREAASSGGVFSSTVAFRGGTLSLVVDPAEVGLNEIHVYVLDDDAAARRQPRADDVADVAAVGERRPARAGDGRRRARALVARLLRPHHPGHVGAHRGRAGVEVRRPAGDRHRAHPPLASRTTLRRTGRHRRAVGQRDLERAVGQQLQLPAVVVHSVVMPAADRQQVVEIGGAAVLPPPDVMDLAASRTAPDSRGSRTVDRAPQHSTLRGARQALPSPQIEIGRWPHRHDMRLGSLDDVTERIEREIDRQVPVDRDLVGPRRIDDDDHLGPACARSLTA